MFFIIKDGYHNVHDFKMNKLFIHIVQTYLFLIINNSIINFNYSCLHVAGEHTFYNASILSLASMQ